MATAGILDEDSRVELIDGKVVDMSGIGDLHVGKVGRLDNLRQRLVGGRAMMSSQSPIHLDDFNEPQLDLTVARFRDDWYETAKPRPADILWLIEVADTSLRRDRALKLPLYARFGITEV